MKKITQLLFLFSFISHVSFAQQIEVFEDDTSGSTSFTDNDQTFDVTTTAVGDVFNIQTFVNGGWNGTAPDDKFLDNTTHNSINDGTNFTIKHSNPDVNFTVKKLYLFCSTKTLNVHSGTLTITGKKDGVTVAGFTITKSSGFANPETFSPNNGFTEIDFTTEGGTDNSNKAIDELVFSSTGNLDYMALDAFEYDFVTKIWDGSDNTDWNTTTNWTSNTIPLSTENVLIPNATSNSPIISSSTGAVANDVTIDAGATLTIESGGSLIIDGTATVNGDFIYNVSVNDDDWHLVSSPVVGEQYDDTWNTANDIATNLPNEAVSSYINTSDANGDWVYFQDGGTATTFGSGIGYSLKKASVSGGEYSFTGTFPAPPINPTITANDIGIPATENRWTLIGNPSPAYINIATFLSDNATSLTDTHESIYVWNATAGGYQALTTGQIHPGQAFFVSSDVATTSVTFTRAMQSHHTGITFYRTSNPKITLVVDDGSKTKSTEINYIAGKTTALDPRFDLGTFTGQTLGLNIYTHLVSNSEGVNFARQALPDSNYENMIIPVGVNADAGLEITFSADVLNLPADIKVFLEDREANTFTRLDEVNSNYKITLNNDVSGIGRFYIHTSTSSVLSTADIFPENISIYKTTNNALRIVGLSDETSNLKLFSILGKQVLSTSFTSHGVNDVTLPALAPGVYIVQLQTDKRKFNKKIILE